MNNNALLVLLVAAGAFVLMKQSKASATTQIAPPASKNVNDQLWSSLLGDGWKMLRDAQTSSGGPAMLERNWLGQVTTTDGKPVGSELADILPTTYGNLIPVDTSDPSTGVDWVSKMGW